MTFAVETSKVKNSPKFFHQSIFGMNTAINMILCNENEELCQSVFESTANLVSEYELILSRYNPDAELYRLNTNAYFNPVSVSPLLWNAIRTGIEYYHQSQGYFNISLGNIYQQAKEGKTSKSFATNELIHAIELDEANQTVFFSNENVSLDFGGLGKGMALNEISKIVDSAGISNAFISFGGSSILTRGHHPNGDHWPLSLHSNHEKVWQLRNDAVSISSTHLHPNTGAIAHIVNPYIFRPVKSGKIVFVKAENPTLAEVLSTTLIASPSFLHSKIALAFHEAEYEVI